MHRRSLVCAIAAAVVLLPATRSRANCAAPIDYWAKVDANTVAVAPSNRQNRTCPDPDGMLRENVQTGEVVRLADYCQPTQYVYAEQAYVDECVAPGSYRYGLAKPFECAPSSCGTSYFVPVTVTEPLPPECDRSAGNAAPTPVDSVPWSTEQYICHYAGGDWPDFNRDAGTAVDASFAEDAGDSGTSTSSDDSGSASGCSTSSSKTVFLFNALLVAAGLIGLRRSRSS